MDNEVLKSIKIIFFKDVKHYFRIDMNLTD